MKPKSWERMTEAERARVRRAAPDLLEALENLLRRCVVGDEDREILDAAEQARAAIAKAREGGR